MKKSIFVLKIKRYENGFLGDMNYGGRNAGLGKEHYFDKSIFNKFK